MTPNKCGILSSHDLSNILVALDNEKNKFIKNNADIAEILTDIEKGTKTGESTTTILRTWTQLSNQKMQINNDHIDRINSTKKKVMECMRE